MVTNSLVRKLDGSEIVTRLKGLEDATFFDSKRLNGKRIFRLEEDIRIKVLSPLVVVPAGVQVYQAKGSYRNKELILFTHRDSDTAAYASIVKPGRKGFKDTPYRNVCDLSKHPWFNKEETFKIYINLETKAGNAVLEGMEGRSGGHPLLSVQ